MIDFSGRYPHDPEPDPQWFNYTDKGMEIDLSHLGITCLVFAGCYIDQTTGFRACIVMVNPETGNSVIVWKSDRIEETPGRNTDGVDEVKRIAQEKLAEIGAIP